VSAGKRTARARMQIAAGQPKINQTRMDEIAVPGQDDDQSL